MGTTDNNPVTASYVMLQFSVFKNEIIESIRSEMRSVVKEELDKYREEVKEQFTEMKSEQKRIVEDKIEELKKAHKLKEDELEERLNKEHERCNDMFMKFESMLNRIVEAEDRQRRLNVVVSNLQIDENLSCVDNAERFFIEKLKIPEEKVKTFIYRNVHYLDREDKGKGRSFIAAFVRQTDRDLVMAHGKELAGTRVSMKANYSPETRARKDELLALKKNLSEQGMTLRVVERSHKPVLQIKDRNGKWSRYEEEY